LLTSPPSHLRELRDLGIFLLLFGALALETFLLPETADVRPWVEGERMPLMGLLEAQADSQAAEDDRSEAPQNRSPALRQSLEKPEHLQPFWASLSALESGSGTGSVRVLHFGDSTIAADGIPGVLRRRFQGRFGNRGPGFLPLQVDTRWVYRPGIRRETEGDWEVWNLTQGRAPHSRYGLGGSPTRLKGAGQLVLHLDESIGRGVSSGSLHVQMQPGGGTLSFGPVGGPQKQVNTASKSVRDLHISLPSEGEFDAVQIQSMGDGPLSFYGLSLETDFQGLTWETLGVAGSSIGSMRRQKKEHLQSEIASRSPQLIVYQTGGNALGYDSFLVGDGRLYKEKYLEILGRLTDAAPDAACLVVGPLDQGRRIRGAVQSHPEIARMVQLQREIAAQAECAFWDARAVMGGDGGFGRWMNHEPTLTWTDLMHLSSEGSSLMGETMADALFEGYDMYAEEVKSSQGEASL
jgi:lysophospholipase L1-like esterase